LGVKGLNRKRQPCPYLRKNHPLPRIHCLPMCKWFRTMFSYDRVKSSLLKFECTIKQANF